MSRPARRLDGRCEPGSPGRQRKVRAPREYGAGQLPAGATSGKVPQKTNRPRLQVRPGAAGKGETVRQERTAPLATGAAGQTPPGARPNRDGRAARRRSISRSAVRVGRARRVERRVPEEWSSRTVHGKPWAVRTEPGLQAVWRHLQFAPQTSPQERNRNYE